MRRRSLVAIAVLMSLFVVLIPATADEGTKFRQPVKSRKGVIATESIPASRAAIRVLNQGGNAIDAAVTAIFTIGVSRPQSCGIGGGGFLVYRGANGKKATLDFRETAPLRTRSTQYASPGIDDTFTGHMTVGVPGVVAGMSKALKRFGTISLRRAIQPAERVAREGFEVPQSFSTDNTSNASRLRMFEETASIYLVDGTTPYPPGATLVQSDYARSLRRIANNGARAFYRGRIAELIVEDMKNGDDQYPGDDGLMRMRDLAEYRAKWRKPIVGTYRGHKIVAMPPPTSGGIAIVEMLNILEGFDVGSFGHSSADHFHHVAEAEKIAFADRGQYVADPDYEDVPRRQLTSKAYAAERRQEIDPNVAKSYSPGAREDESAAAARTGSASVSSDDLNEEASTTHVSVIDKKGNAVAVTCTIEQSFGSAVVAPGTGFLLNNELTDFGAPGSANEPEGGKRPRSSMSPTIVVRRGEPVLVTGGAGGFRIIMGVFHTVLNVIDFGMNVAHAVDAERMDETSLPNMNIEDVRVSPVDQAALEAKGHVLVREGEYNVRPRVNVAGAVLHNRKNHAVSDPRTDDAARAQR